MAPVGVGVGVGVGSGSGDCTFTVTERVVTCPEESVIVAVSVTSSPSELGARRPLSPGDSYGAVAARAEVGVAGLERDRLRRRSRRRRTRTACSRLRACTTPVPDGESSSPVGGRSAIAVGTLGAAIAVVRKPEKLIAAPLTRSPAGGGVESDGPAALPHQLPVAVNATAWSAPAPVSLRAPKPLPVMLLPVAVSFVVVPPVGGRREVEVDQPHAGRRGVVGAPGCW